MSLIERLFPRRACVALAPGVLTVLVRRGKRIDAESAVRLAVDEGWQGAVHGLRSWLASVKGGAMEVSVSLPSQWCQFTVLPWSDALLQAESARRFAAMQFAVTYGDAAHAWQIVIDAAPYGAPRLACAIEQDLLTALEEAVTSSGHQLARVEPVLAYAWRAARGRRPQALALLEGRRVVLAAAQDGRITAVQSEALRGEWPHALEQAWQRWVLREPALADIAQITLLKVDAAHKGEAPERFHTLPLPVQTLDAAFAGACLIGA